MVAAAVFPASCRLSLLPDRLGVIDCAPAELCCSLPLAVSHRRTNAPSLAAGRKEQARRKSPQLDRAIARKENGLRGLSSRMSKAGENGKIWCWAGSAQSCRAVHSLRWPSPATFRALKETGAKLDTDDEHEAKTGAHCSTFSVSPDLLKLRRELGLTEKE